MPQFDMPLAEMRRYSPQLAVPADLDEFWAGTLEDARSHLRRVRDALVGALSTGALSQERLQESLRRYDRGLASATAPTPPVTRGPFESANALADALLGHDHSAVAAHSQLSAVLCGSPAHSEAERVA